MKILIATNHLDALGGSETFTHTIVKAAVEYGAQVEIITHKHGMVSRKIQDDFDVPFRRSNTYDLVLANHNTMVDHCSAQGYGPIIQTCHGIFPKLEQPSVHAHAYVAISEEVLQHVQNIALQSIPSMVIRNMIDTDRFDILNPVSDRCMAIYSLSQSEEFNAELGRFCHDMGISFNYNNKFMYAIWHTETLINNADMVVSLGRGAMEAMSCGRQVIVADHRPYQDQISDGVINHFNVDTLATCNFSGRLTRQKPGIWELLSDAIEAYDYNESYLLRDWAVKNLDYRNQFMKYIELWKEIA